MSDRNVRTFEMVETGDLRARLEAAVQAMIDLLDSLEPDPDLEPAGDELDASYPEGSRRFDGPPDEDAEDGGDNEPWLGRLEGWVDQSSHTCGGSDDREGGDDPREFSWNESVDQTRLHCASGHEDHEEDDAPEDDDPGGGDVNDEPHDAGDDDSRACDNDALILLHDELSFARMMDASLEDRQAVNAETLQALANLTGRSFRTHHFPPRTYRRQSGARINNAI